MADVGGSIKINSKYLRTDTYEIKAIGNKAYLESSIFGKGGYAEQLNTTGIKTDIERKNKIIYAIFLVVSAFLIYNAMMPTRRA